VAPAADKRALCNTPRGPKDNKQRAQRTGLVARRLLRCARHTGHSLTSAGLCACVAWCGVWCGVEGRKRHKRVRGCACWRRRFWAKQLPQTGSAAGPHSPPPFPLCFQAVRPRRRRRLQHYILTPALWLAGAARCSARSSGAGRPSRRARRGSCLLRVEPKDQERGEKGGVKHVRAPAAAATRGVRRPLPFSLLPPASRPAAPQN
jgi:hypothetical protein